MKKILFLCCAFLSLFCHAEMEKNPFEDVHPYAFQRLAGGDFHLPDINYPIVGINVSKLKTTKHCQELENKKLYRSDYKNSMGYHRQKTDGTYYGGYLFFSVYKKLTSKNCFIIDCNDNGGGRRTFTSYLFIKKHRKNYYDSGEIKIIDILTCEGDFGKNAPSNEIIEKVEKFTKQKPQSKEIEPSDKEFKDIHPYAFYYLSGGDYRLQDTERSIISVNASKFKLSIKSNEVSGKTVYIKDNKIGFTYKLDSLAQDKKHLEKDNFYVVVYKKLSNLNYYIVKCVFTRGNNIPQVDYLLIRKHYKYYYYWDKFAVMEVLTCDGDFGKNAPSNEEIERVTKLISKKIIGDIP